MISLKPSDRPTFDTLLHTSRGTVFPECFYSYLHNYVSSINELSHEGLGLGMTTPSTPATFTHSSAAPSVSGTTIRPSTLSMGTVVGNESHNDPLPSDSDHRLERIWADYESIEPYISPEPVSNTETTDVKIDYVSSSIATAQPYKVINLPLMC